MNDLNEALKRYEPRPIEEAPRDGRFILTYHPQIEEYAIYTGAGTIRNRVMQGFPENEIYWQERQTYPPTYFLPLPIFDKPDPRNEALRLAWEALAFYAQPTETVTGDDPDEPDWPIVVHQWPGNDDGEKAREAQAAILKALEGGE